jgi:transcriptional regulator with XRE-family HTH domain
MTVRQTTPTDPYAYVLGGLPRVGLVGITVHRCTACDVDVPTIPKIGELHHVLARGFLRKNGLLAGDELRFIRKQAGFRAQDFAEKIGLDPSYLSRVENGKLDSLGETSDRLARAVAAAVIDPDLLKEIVLRAALEGTPIRKPLQAILKRNRWSAAERAA